MQGLLEKTNSEGHKVIKLHYSADPEKTSAWIESKSKQYLGGIGSKGWRREMEMDLKAGEGENVFPFFIDIYDSIVKEFDISLDEKWTFYGGFDWGVRNPVAFLLFGAKEINNEVYFHAFYEYYTVNQHVKEIATNIKNCPFYSKMEWIAADPSIWTENQMTREGGFVSVAEMLQNEEDVGEQNVIENLIAAHGRSDEMAISKIKLFWSCDKPKLTISPSCPHLIEELKDLSYPPQGGGLSSSPTEKIIDKNNHCFDALKYFILSHPYCKTFTEKPSFGTLAYINKTSDTAARLSEMSGRSVQEEFNHIYGR